MVEQEVPLEIKRMEADGGRTIAHKAAHPLDETTYDTTDDDRKIRSIPKGILHKIWGFAQSHRKTKCENKEEEDHYGRRYRNCPVPVRNRFGRDRKDPPWYCGYCRLFDDPDVDGGA